MNFATFCRNEGLIIFLGICWFAINGFLFCYQYFTMRFDDKFHYLFLMLGDVIFLSRGTGLVLNFNCALILLPMNRYFNSWIRSHILKHSKSSIRRLFDHTKGIHVVIALTICIVGVLHTVLHLINGFNFHKQFSEAVPELNILPTKSQTTLLRFSALVPGWTGFILLFCMLLLGVSSFKAIRRLHHEIFAYIHYLSFVFVAILMYHGFGKVTKFQVNLEEHPLLCHSLQSIINDPLCKGKAEFDYVKPASWKWMAGPLFLHIIDRLIRFYRARKECKVVAMRHHDSDVVEVVFSKKNFISKPGQFIWVQCKEISDFEWHAFTLTKCPNRDSEDPTFSVHIKVVGDWTMKLSNLVKSMQKETQSKRVGYSCVVELDEEKKEEGLPVTFRVDGPYGSPHQDTFRYPINISIATGIGITPFLATLNGLKDNFKQRTAKGTFKLKKMYLIWVCKSTKEFSWVLNTVEEVKKELEENKAGDLLELHLFVTREKKEEQNSEKVPTWQVGTTDTITPGKVNYGRPNFRTEISKKVEMHKNQRIGVFYCGSQPLGKKIYEEMKYIQGAENVLIFNKESFG